MLKAFPNDLPYVGHYDKRIGVGLFDDSTDLEHFLPAHHTQQHFLILPGIRPLRLEHRDPALDVFQDAFGDGIVWSDTMSIIFPVSAP